MIPILDLNLPLSSFQAELASAEKSQASTHSDGKPTLVVAAYETDVYMEVEKHNFVSSVEVDTSNIIGIG